jgi:hypothetical protein
MQIRVGLVLFVSTSTVTRSSLSNKSMRKNTSSKSNDSFLASPQVVETLHFLPVDCGTLVFELTDKLDLETVLISFVSLRGSQEQTLG